VEVLRLETHAHGEGPYQLDLGGSTSYGQPTRPSPYEDIPTWDDESRRGWFFGFLDREQMHRWWDEAEVGRMLEAGLQISVYEVPDHKAVVGCCQVAFHLGSAIYLRREAL
jgi:hypothetical protein